MSSTSDWPAYVSSLGSTAEIARAAGVNFSTVARWKTGANPPAPSNVIDLARALKHSPLDALVAAGYLTADEVRSAARNVPKAYALRDYSDLDLAKEAVRRIEEGSSTALLEQPLDEQHPAMGPAEGESTTGWRERSLRRMRDNEARERAVGGLSDDELSRLPQAAGTDETTPDEE